MIEFSAFFINLVGVYEIIIIMNSLFEIIKQDIFFLFTNTKKITFHEALIQLSLRDIQETKIEMWSSIIGEIFLESFILYIFPFQKDENLNLNYSIFELIELIIIYCVLFICVESSSLFIYQKFNSFLNQSIDAEEKDEKEIQKIVIIFSLFFLSLVSMYFKNYLNYVTIKNFNKSNNKRKFLFLIFLIYIISFIISFIFQLLYDYMRKEESFKLDCNCCNNCICCCNCCIEKCFKCCCRTKNQNKKTVLKLKKKNVIFVVIYIMKKIGKKQKLMRLIKIQIFLFQILHL